MATVAMKKAMEANAGSPTRNVTDPLDEEAEDVRSTKKVCNSSTVTISCSHKTIITFILRIKPEVTANRLKAYKDTLVVHADPNKGVEENEQDFQETVERFCVYLEPEIEQAIKAVEAAEKEKDYDDLVKRTWIPPDGELYMYISSPKY